MSVVVENIETTEVPHGAESVEMTLPSFGGYVFEALAAAAAKPAATGLTYMAKRWWTAATFYGRTSKWIAEAARSNGIEISRHDLRRAMAKAQVRQLLEHHGGNAKDAVMDSLRDVQMTTTAGKPITSEEIFDLVSLGYVRASSSADGLVAVARELRAVSETVDRGASQAATFPHNLRRLPPPLAAEAHRLRDTYETLIPRLVSNLVTADNRRDLLSQWSRSRPMWLEASSEIDGWLAEVANEHDARALSAKWFKAAVEQGATPTAYWKVRAVITAEQDGDEALEYLEDCLEHPLVQAILASNSRELRRQRLDEWTPTSQTQDAFKAALSTQNLAEAGDYGSAIEQGKKAFTDHGFYGAGLVAVDSHLRRGASGERRALASDFSEALQFSLVLRDKRREWEASSGRAVAYAMHACALLLDPERAWKLSQLAPVGDASTPEAVHPKVREAAIVLMAERGSVEDALKLVDRSYSQSAQLQVRAREAELLSDESLAHDLWSQAIEAAPDWNEKASIAYRQAYHGVLDPFVEKLRPENEEVANEIQLIFELFSHAPGAENRAEKALASNRRIGHALIQFFADENRLEDMTSAAERSARQWGDAADWLRASRGHRQARRFGDALDRAGKAILAGGPDWGDKEAALSIQVECAASIENWTTAIFAAQELLTISSSSSQARWALVRCHLGAGEDEQAFGAWKDAIELLIPSNAAEAQAWLYLFRQHGAAMAPLSEVKAIANRFSDDQQVRNLALAAAMFAPRDGDEDSTIAASLFEDYERDYPDSTAFRAFHGDTENPAALLAQLDAIAGTRTDFAELEKSIVEGAVPVGLLSVLAHGFLAEKLIQASRRPRFAGLMFPADEGEIVATALGSVVVADTTALLTLALIPELVADDLARRLVIRTSSRQLIDANASRESLSRAIGGYFVPSSVNGPARVEREDETEYARRRSVATRLVDLFMRSERDSTERGTSALPADIRDLGGAWSAAIDLAHRQGLPLWCDDAATRRLATAVGVASFGTPALVEHLRQEAHVAREEADTADAALVQACCVGVRFRTDAYALALELDHRAPLGVAEAIRQSDGTDAESKMQLVLKALRVANTNPEWLQRWVFLATEYLIAIAGERTDQVDNVKLLLENLLTAPWVSASSFLFTAGAMRAADGDLWASALPEAFRFVFASIVRTHGYEIAGNYVRGLVANLPESERLSVMSIVLER